jgi:hypothetical protein
MKKPIDIENKINQTLNSLDGLGKAEAKPFFYSRLEARMQNQLVGSTTRFAILGNMKLNVAVLIFFMVFNLFTFFSINDASEDSNGREDQIELLAQDYFSGSDDYQYLNDY